jgi:hypothetical protein
MSNLREAAQQALEVLESGLLVSHHAQVLIDLRAALEQPPMTVDTLAHALVMTRIIDASAVDDPEGYDDGVMLKCVRKLHYKLMETPEQPEQEPVAFYLPQDGEDDSLFRDARTVIACTGNKWLGWIPLYTHPPRRTGLPHCERSCEAQAFQIEIRRLKAALKDKNHE